MLLLVAMASFVNAHKFYLSVSEISYSQTDKTIRMTSRIFTEDLNALLKKRYDIDAKLGTDEENKLAELYLEKYLRLKLAININGQSLNYTILGKKVTDDMVVFFIEIPWEEESTIDNMLVVNSILTDVYEEQQNVLHIKLQGIRKSFLLIKENPEALLNF